MTTAITVFVLIVVLIGAFILGLLVRGHEGVRRTWEVLEAGLESSDLTDMQRLEVVKKMREVLRSKKS